MKHHVVTVEVTASQAIVPTLSNMSIDLRPDANRGQLLDGITVIFPVPDVLYETLVQLAGGIAARMTARDTLESMRGLYQATNQQSPVAVFLNTVKSTSAPVFIPSFAVITDIDIVNAVLTNTK